MAKVDFDRRGEGIARAWDRWSHRRSAALVIFAGVAFWAILIFALSYFLAK
jgi:hypothetical protein